MAQRKKSNRRALAVIGIILGLLLSIIAVAGISVLFFLNDGPEKVAANSPEIIDTDASTDDPLTESDPTYVRMMCAGDNLIHKSIFTQAKARSSTGRYDFTYAYEKIAPIIQKADIAFLNQETVIVPSREPSTYPLFNSPKELGDHMVDIGFNVFNLGTNHTIDCGVSGAFEMIEYWKTKPGIITTGLYENNEDMYKVRKHTVNEITFSYVGFTEYLNGLRIPESSELRIVSPVGANMSEDEFYTTMRTMIEAARDESDIVCVSIHFQQEDITTPNTSQEKIVAALIEYGADVIIGTGPHSLQPMKFVERDDGSRALVIYSLGNFISAQAKAVNMPGGIADITFMKDYTGKVSIEKAKLIPTITQYEGSFKNIRIIPFSQYSSDMANAHGVRNKQSKYTYSYVENLYNELFGEEFLEIEVE